MATCDHLRLIGTPDTNKVMAAEMVRLAWQAGKFRPPSPRKVGKWSLLYPFDADLAHIAVSYHRTATRVLWDLYQSDAMRLTPLYEVLKGDIAGDTRPWLSDGAGISVSARHVGAFAAGERQVVGAVKNAIIDGARMRGLTLHVNPEKPDVPIMVRMDDDGIVVSIDLAGASRSQRGYRIARGAAPLREHLAAVLLMLSRYDARSEILLDPMCGAGTICIEAALMARAQPVWASDHPAAYLRLPPFRGYQAAERALFAETKPIILGSDRAGNSLRAARSNAASAGVDVHWTQAEIGQLSRDSIGAVLDREGRSETSGLIVCNPPYGHRLTPGDLTQTYRNLAEWCDQFAGWRAGFLVANPTWERTFGRRPKVRKPLSNGSIRANFFLYEL